MTPSRPLAVGITPLETRREVIVHVAVRAEELGYDLVAVAEAWGHDVSVLLSEIALRTSRIRIGTGVVNVWGRSAATIAMMATSLDELSGGRFVLGLGAGTAQLAEGLHDVAFDKPVERLGRVTRQVRGAARRRARHVVGARRQQAAAARGARPVRDPGPDGRARAERRPALR
jgi:alkanesulfonate monooxygenase SsuD/methylene tetrahydromethanopterin reductase-like flavin-dependent oxidoreductase (luciferase family)